MASVVTWNMQGGNATTEVKWHTGVQNLMHEGAEIVCVQESGGIPPSAQLWQNNLGGDPAYTLYRWGTDRAHKFISFYPWDVNGNRVNQAIISFQPPTNWAVVWPAAAPLWRPAIGAQIGGLWYFCVHAISPGGPDAAGLLAGINAGAGGANWVALGDFNREPAPPLPTGNLWPANHPTYSVSNPQRYYDYAYSNGPSITGTRIDALIMSDHYAVHFGF